MGEKTEAQKHAQKNYMKLFWCDTREIIRCLITISI